MFLKTGKKLGGPFADKLENLNEEAKIKKQK
jgi:hypothetical protein